VQPTVAEILALPEMARGQPRVMAGADGLSRPVRWVHISEHEDIARLMYGGELVLTTGVAWPDTPKARTRFIEDLADGGAAAVAIELVRRFHEVPPEMVAAARRRGLTLVALEREIRFIDVTQAVHALIIDAQLADLRVLDTAHRAFTRLGVEGASLEEILGQVAEITGRPAVLENVAHQVTAYACADLEPTHLLGQWESRSRRAGGVEEGPGSTWLVTEVAARERRFGRVLLVTDTAVPPWTQAVLDQAALTIALRLLERDAATLERQAHGGLVSAIFERSYASVQWLHLRAESLGVVLKDRTVIGLCVLLHRIPGEVAESERQALEREDAEAVAAAVRSSGVPGLVGGRGRGEVAVLLSLPRERSVEGSLEHVTRTIQRAFIGAGHVRCTIGAGSAVRTVDEARRSLLEAEHAAASVPEADDDRLYYRLADVGIAGLAHLLRDDPRVQAFVERMLQDLLAHDRRHRGDLEAVLWAFLEAGGNKSLGAESYGLSRPAFYARLSRIEQVLGVDLKQAEVRTSLHFALMALRRMRAAAPAAH
jgi:purine catabolism regulator